MSDATPTNLIDNEKVKVTEWKFKPGQSTGWHRHEMDYVVVPVTTGKLLLKEPDGERTVDLIIGQPYFRDILRTNKSYLLHCVQFLQCISPYSRVL